MSKKRQTRPSVKLPPEYDIEPGDSKQERLVFKLGEVVGRISHLSDPDTGEDAWCAEKKDVWMGRDVWDVVTFGLHSEQGALRKLIDETKV